MVIYTDNLIVSEFRAGKTIDGIAKNMLLVKKGNGIKSTKRECKQEVEMAVLNYVLSKNKNAG
jgi:hypothetical protein